MYFARFLAPNLKKLISVFDRQYQEAAFNVNAKQELFPDVNQVYLSLKNKKWNKDGLSVAMQNSIFMFLEGWPIIAYLNKISVLCSHNSVINFIYSNLESTKQDKFTESIVLLVSNLSKQAMLVKIFLEQQVLNEYMASKWNKLQNKIFINSVDILELCSEVHLQESNPKIKGVLMRPENALKWFDFLFGNNSQIMINTTENSQARKRQLTTYKFIKYAAVFCVFPAIILTFMGSTSYRDIYILMLFATIAVAIFFRHKEKKLIKGPEQQVSESREWLTNVIPTEVYAPNFVLKKELGF